MIALTAAGAEAGAIARPSGAIVAFAPGAVRVGAASGAGAGVRSRAACSPRATASLQRALLARG